MAVSDWSATADENTSIDGINIAEHCPAKNMNDALRAVMAALKNKCDALDSTDNTLRLGAVIGEVRWFAMSTPPEGWLVCNGASVGTSDYPALFAAIRNTFLPEDVPASPSAFKLPNLMGKVPWGATSVGTVLDAGLPNITGQISARAVNGSDNPILWAASSGALYYNNRGGERADPLDSSSIYATDNHLYNLDASRSSSIYGNSTTVQPPALCLLPCIRYE